MWWMVANIPKWDVTGPHNHCKFRTLLRTGIMVQWVKLLSVMLTFCARALVQVHAVHFLYYFHSKSPGKIMEDGQVLFAANSCGRCWAGFCLMDSALYSSSHCGHLSNDSADGRSPSLAVSLCHFVFKWNKSVWMNLYWNKPFESNINRVYKTLNELQDTKTKIEFKLIFQVNCKVFFHL